jgi:hypothetical protein
MMVLDKMQEFVFKVQGLSKNWLIWCNMISDTKLWQLHINVQPTLVTSTYRNLSICNNNYISPNLPLVFSVYYQSSTMLTSSVKTHMVSSKAVVKITLICI